MADESQVEEKAYAKKAKPLNQHEKLKKSLIEHVQHVGRVEEWNNQVEEDLPKKWKLSNGELLILPADCFRHEFWSHMSEPWWPVVAQCFKVKRIARENRVKSDGYRTPNLELCYGDDSTVTVNNNGIKYTYDFTKCMFSWGNITEKLRIASFDCSNETVVDLFAGIGYFTLVYLVHARAKKLIACEWNPASVEALKNNLIQNKCQDRCEILQGDNRLTCPKNCADRVNLGLIPSSESSWPTACNALKANTGGVLHIHGNVDLAKTTAKSDKNKPEWTEWSEYARDTVEKLLNERTREENLKWSVQIDHIEYVKSYGPRVDHLVLDLLCKPNKNQ